MPQQFHHAEEPAPLRTGVPEPLAAATAEKTTAIDAPRYTSDEAKRILAEAARLQTYHRETLSPSEVEAVGQEAGIEPEFVRRAMEQVKSASRPVSRYKKRLPFVGPRLQPLPLSAYAKTAVVPLLYTVLLISVTSWQPQSGFARWFHLLYDLLPLLLAFGMGFLRKGVRLSAASGAFWGLGLLFALSFPIFTKEFQDAVGFSSDLLRMLGGMFQFLPLFLLLGAAFGVAGALTRRGVEKGRKWVGKRRSNKTRSSRTALQGL